MDARLRVLSGPMSGETIPVIGKKLLIGREQDCNLRSDSEFISRHHCVLLLDEYSLRIRDLGSKNGTYVNSRRLGTSETVLLHDDMVAIGEMTFQVDLAAPTTEPKQPAELIGTGIFDDQTVRDIPLTRETQSLPQTPPIPVEADTQQMTQPQEQPQG